MNKRLIESYRSNLSRTSVWGPCSDASYHGWKCQRETLVTWSPPQSLHDPTHHSELLWRAKGHIRLLQQSYFFSVFLHHLAGSSNGCLIQDIGDSFIEYFITCSKIKDCRLLKANYSWCQLPIISLFCSWSDELLQSLLHAACSRVSYVPSLSWAGSYRCKQYSAQSIEKSAPGILTSLTPGFNEFVMEKQSTGLYGFPQTIYIQHTFTSWNSFVPWDVRHEKVQRLPHCCWQPPACCSSEG